MTPFDEPFLVRSLPGYTPAVGRLLCMLNYARLTTLEAVSGLDRAQLDTLPDPDGNSVAMLLAHIAAVEGFYRMLTFEQPDDPAADAAWESDPAATLGEPARQSIRGRPLEHYLGLLSGERTKTLEAFASVDDAWLERTTPWWGGHAANNHFKWFHVLEDEINHRGQIRALRRRIGE